MGRASVSLSSLCIEATLQSIKRGRTRLYDASRWTGVTPADAVADRAGMDSTRRIPPSPLHAAVAPTWRASLLIRPTPVPQDRSAVVRPLVSRARQRQWKRRCSSCHGLSTPDILMVSLCTPRVRHFGECSKQDSEWHRAILRSWKVASIQPLRHPAATHVQPATAELNDPTLPPLKLMPLW